MNRRLFYSAAFLLATSLQLPAASFSLSGKFSQDDNVQLFNVTVASTATVTFQTNSYAGGLDAAGVTIAEGGFDPTLSLFSSTGALLRTKDDGTCAQVGIDSRSGLCADSYFRLSLTPGVYTLALTEFDNEPNGALSSGFSRQGQGNFTGPAFSPSGAPGSFYDLFGYQRTSSWEVDITGVASAAAVPEPASLGIVSLGGLLACLALRRSRAAC